jgi:hypothetical protein
MLLRAWQQLPNDVENQITLYSTIKFCNYATGKITQHCQLSNNTLLQKKLTQGHECKMFHCQLPQVHLKKV